jgi:hypothetical protein
VTGAIARGTARNANLPIAVPAKIILSARQNTFDGREPRHPDPVSGVFYFQAE